MYVLMIYQTGLLAEGMHSYTVTYHYVCTDVLSDFSFYWMPNYTFDLCNSAHHYVCIDVLSDGSVEWIPFYTQV
jgi:hypothetical protein